MTYVMCTGNRQKDDGGRVRSIFLGGIPHRHLIQNGNGEQRYGRFPKEVTSKSGLEQGAEAEECVSSSVVGKIEVHFRHQR